MILHVDLVVRQGVFKAFIEVYDKACLKHLKILLCRNEISAHRASATPQKKHIEAEADLMCEVEA